MSFAQHKLASRPGTTIVELVVAITIMVLVMGAVLPLLGSLRNSWDVAQNSVDAVQNGRVMVNHINLNLGQALRITDVSPTSQTLGYIEFEDTNGDTLRYDVGTDGYVEYGPAGAQVKLAGPVSQLVFTCYDGNDFSTPTTTAADIRFVEIQATVVNAGVMGRDKTVAGSVYLSVNGNPAADGTSMGPHFEFDTSSGKEPALAGIDGLHYLCAYEGASSDGWATVLAVNPSTWAITRGAPYEFDDVQGEEPALGEIGNGQYLVAYRGDDDDGWAKILTVDTGTWTIDRGVPFEFDTSRCLRPALAKIDDSHFLCAYTGYGDDGWAVVLSIGSGQVGHWALDESSGTVATDGSEYSNHGTLMNMAGNEWTAGQQGGALEFSGYNDYIVVSNAASLQPTSALTIAAWIKGDAWGSWSDVDAILRKGTSTPCNYQLAIADGKVSLMLDDLDGGGGIRGDTTLNTGQWYHVAATWNGSTVRIYVDGVLDNDPPDARTGTIGTDTRSVYIGGRPNDDYFNGVVDDVRFYGRALSAAEIASLAQTLRYESFTEAKASTETTSITVDTPPSLSAGDLLVAAVATDGDTSTTLAPPGGQGWNQIGLNDYANAVTLGAWWKLAEASEPGTHQFTWSGSKQAYAWIMRFTGHDATNPINAYNQTGSTSSNPSSPAVTTTVNNALILRLGAFDDDDIQADLPGLPGHTAITMDSTGSAGSGQVVFEEFTEKKRGSNNDDITLDTPPGTGAGDLLIAAVVTDSETDDDLAPPGGQGWTEIYLGDESDRVTLGVWWKIAGGSEPSTHRFEWDSNQEAYAFMMRFTGHDPSNPIHDWDKRDSYSSSPNCDAVTTTVANCMILRIGGFDDDDINVDNTGLEGCTDITMDESSSGGGTCSGGAAYEQQATPGESSTPDFNLTGYEQYITLAVAIAPGAGGGGGGDTVSGGAGYVKQTTAGSSGTSNFSLTAAEQSQMLSLAIAPATVTESAMAAVTKSTPFEYDTGRGMEAALAQIDSTHYLCAYKGNGYDGFAVVLTVDTSDWTVSRGTPFEFNTIQCERPALARIDSTHFLCSYAGNGDGGWSTILTVNPSTWTVSQETPFVYDSVRGMEPALAQMDATHYLCAYRGDGDDGWSVVLNVDPATWTLSSGSPFEYNPVRGKRPDLIQIDADHYLCAYSGNGDDGWSVVLMPTTGVVTP